MVPFMSVSVYGVLPPDAIVVRSRFALNVPTSEMSPVRVAGPEATYEVPKLVKVALIVIVVFEFPDGGDPTVMVTFTVSVAPLVVTKEMVPLHVVPLVIPVGLTVTGISNAVEDAV